MLWLLPGLPPQGDLADRLINTFTRRGRLRHLPGQAARLVRPNGPGVRALGKVLRLGQSRNESEEPRASARPWPQPASGIRPPTRRKAAAGREHIRVGGRGGHRLLTEGPLPGAH
jgi:hypothetical protein